VADKVKLAEIAQSLRPAFEAWAAWRLPGEALGDFCARLGPDTIRRLLAPEPVAAE
jgi:sulfite reductase beta subunit-like hemoprotein